MSHTFIWFQLKSRCVNVVFSFSRSPNAAAVLFPSELLERLRTCMVCMCSQGYALHSHQLSKPCAAKVVGTLTV
eukprot:308952-Pelagomonas_calceolata.AAC.1